MANKDYFAWSRTNVLGIDPELTSHKLKIDPNHKPIHQKMRKFGVDRNLVVNEVVR